MARLGDGVGGGETDGSRSSSTTSASAAAGSALTDPRRLAHWMDKVEGDLRLGSEFRTRCVLSGPSPRAAANGQPSRIPAAVIDDPGRELDTASLT